MENQHGGGQPDPVDARVRAALERLERHELDQASARVVGPAADAVTHAVDGATQSAAIQRGAERAISRVFSTSAGATAAEGGPAKPAPGALVRAIAEIANDQSFARASTLGLRPHWSEPVEVWVARAVVALRRGAGVLLTVDAVLEPFAVALEKEWAGTPGIATLVVVVDRGLDVVRLLAARSEIELDVAAPDVPAAKLQASLDAIRVATRASRRAPDEAGTCSWFGSGVVPEPDAPIRLRRAAGALATYGVDTTGASLCIRADEDAKAAAEMVVEAAFGQAALGGYGTRAVSRVLVAPALYAAFTAALLDLVRDPGDMVLEPPPWLRADGATLTRRMDAAILAARRTGLDEGGTLIFERRKKGARALVFANVEARMQLGSILSAPGVLALLRATRSHAGSNPVDAS